MNSFNRRRVLLPWLLSMPLWLCGCISLPPTASALSIDFTAQPEPIYSRERGHGFESGAPRNAAGQSSFFTVDVPSEGNYRVTATLIWLLPVKRQDPVLCGADIELNLLPDGERDGA